MRLRLATVLLTAAAVWVVTAAPAGAADCNGVAATMTGTEGADFISGGPGVDVIAALGGNDEILGAGGNDLICGGDGIDIIYNYDVPPAPSGYTEIINLTAGTATGMAGSDQLFGIENAFGTDFSDSITGTDARNELTGGEGADLINGLAGEDRLVGDGNADTSINQPEGADEIHGGNDFDFLIGGGGEDQLFGEGSRDRLAGEDGNDLIDGGADYDFAHYACNYGSAFCNPYRVSGSGVTVDEQAQTVTGGHGTDQLVSTEGAVGSDYADTLLGRPSGEESDYFAPRMGNDFIDGRGGADYIDYICGRIFEAGTCGGTGVTIDFPTGTVTGGQGTDQFVNVQHAVGSTVGDTITGDAQDNDLWGQQGDDTIDGGDGNDGITGEQGDDTLGGGGGTDRLNYSIFQCSGRGVRVQLAGGTAVGDGSDTIVKGSFELVIGSGCDDVLTGAGTNDTLYGSGGSDDLFGRAGNDLLVPHLTSTGIIYETVTNGADTVFGGSGDDTVSYSGAASGVQIDLASGAVPDDGDGKVDRVLAVEEVVGSLQSDTIDGSAAPNYLLGERGDDVLRGRGENDYLDGQLGNDAVDGGPGQEDFVDYLYGPASVNLNLGTGAAQIVNPDGSVETDTLAGIEGAAGTNGADSLTGSRGPDDLFGEGGDDGTIRGQAGDDLLLGGGAGLVGDPGVQSLLGGKGSDWCFAGTTKGCEQRSNPAPALLGQRRPTELDGLVVLRAARELRNTGLGELLRLEAALDAMRVHRREDPNA